MRPGVKKSVVWRYFVKNADKTVSCNMCKKQFKYFGGTSNLKQHLERVHPISYLQNEIIPSSDSSADVVEVSKENTESQPCTSQAIVKDTMINSKNVEVIPTKQLKLFGSKQQSNLSEKKVSEIDNALIKMITKDYQPLSVVENAGFLEYSKALQPLYTPPSRKKLTYDLLPKQYEEATSTLIKIINDVKYISVTTDIWTSDSNKAYITVTAHFIFKSVLRAHVLSTRELPGSHTGENISLMLGDIFHHWKIENKIIAVVSDNGANIKSAISNYLQIFHLPCVAHTLNLIVTKSLTDVAELNDILKKCRALVNHFKHSSLACDKLRSVQEQMGLPNLKVKQEVVTRWNSCFHMLQRLLEIKNPLCVAVANLSKPPEFLNADDWEVINDCIKVLKQADDITRLLSSENYPTVSLLIPIIRGIQFALQNTTVVTNVGDSLKLKLLQTIHQRLGSFESSKTIAKATFLDPRFKKDGFGNEENANNAEKWVTDEIKLILSKKTESTASPQLKTNSDQTNQPSTENLNIWTHFDRKVSEKRHFSNSTTTAIIMIRQYLELPLQERNKDPLEFWTKHQILLPELYELAVKYLCIPGTSVPSERVFSKAGQLSNLRRSRLSPKNLDQIIFLNSNC
ncbi:unnamed protein product [Diabrotica balteata]|uniref:BED-type domain-containing protein n=1 Tax=Diabrotica balteata TaxID=107213 RepID=A0A9N9X6V9_DIABA|nr:unnamed protein product [Diabrotica balteata]